MIGAAFAGFLPAARAASLVSHAPILIQGNAGFNATNGVIGGSGSAADPYVIAGWSIDAPPALGVQIRGTSAHALVRDVAVTGAPTAGFYAFDASNLTFSNVTALGSAGDGLRLESSHQVTVQRSTVTANGNGIAVVGCANVSVVANNVTMNRGDGVVVSGSTAVLVRANVIAHAGLYTGYGLDLASSTNVTVEQNRFTANDIFLDGTASVHFTTHTITPDNVVSGLPILYLAGRTGFSLAGPQLGELLVAGCTHMTVANLTAAGGDLGVEVAVSSDVILGPNLTVSDALLGVRIVSSSSVRLTGGAILDTSTGVSIESSTSITVTGTKVSAPFATSGPGNAVDVLGSDRVNLTNNLVRHHVAGIHVSGSGNVSLVGNVASLNAFGAQLEGSRNLIVVRNLLAQDGTSLDASRLTNATFARNGFEGASLGANVSASAGLRFLQNAFLGDALGARDTNATADTWDGGYPIGGNFWSNYSGVDRCSGALQNVCTGPDGIGDTPYRFDVNGTDRYPLMRSPPLADVPPEALFYLAPPVGTEITTFAASANLSSDYEDALSFLEVRWNWDGTWTPWTAAKSSTHTYPAPGTYALSLEVRDRANLTDTWTTSIRVVPKPDYLPPAITAVVPSSVEVGQPIVVVANITDASGVQNATLLFRGVDGGVFQALPMIVEINGVNFTATIPAQAHAGSVEYVIVANDTWENPARAPLTGVSTVSVTDPTAALLLDLVLPAVVAGAAAAVVFFLWRRRRRKLGSMNEGSAPPPSP